LCGGSRRQESQRHEEGTDSLHQPRLLPVHAVRPTVFRYLEIFVNRSDVGGWGPPVSLMAR